MRNVVLHCPALKRDLTALRAAIPNLLIHEGAYTPGRRTGSNNGQRDIVREALALGADRLFIVEDDCQFTKHFDYARWCADADWAEAHGYDLLVGGCTRTYEPRLVRSGLIAVRAFHSAHCVIYFPSGYKRALAGGAPWDYSLGQRCGLKCVLTYPFVAVQRPSFSGIENKAVNYVPLYQRHEADLKRQLRISA